MRIHRFIIGSLIGIQLGTAAGSPEPEPRFKATAELVLLPVTVIDRRGAPVIGLPRESFSVTQDDLPRRIVSFGREDVPVSIGIVFDTSGSMGPVLATAGEVLRNILRAADQEDEAFLYTVSTAPGIEGAFTSDFGALLSRSIYLHADGGTALVDAVYAALKSCRRAQNKRRALVVISDGMDNHSRYSKRDLMRLAEEADTPIYTLSVFETTPGRKPIEMREEREGLFFLKELSRRSGGIQTVANSGHIVTAATRMGEAIRSQYLIGYYAEDLLQNRKWHATHVKTNLPGAKAFTRSGFVHQ